MRYFQVFLGISSILSLCNGLPSVAVAIQFFGMPALESTPGIKSHKMTIRQAEQIILVASNNCNNLC